MEHNHLLRQRYYRLFLVGILLMSFGLRVYRLGHQSLRGDESLTYIYSGGSLAKLLEIVRFASHHPPAYYSAMHGWIALAGSTEFALRFASVISGVLLVAALAALGKILVDTRLGLATALLVAVNPYHIFYAQDARSYPLVTLLGVLSTVGLWQALRRERWRDWLTYGALVLLATYTHYYAVFIAIFQGLFVLFYGWRQRRFPWKYAVIGVADVLLYLPWLLLSWGLVTGYEGSGETVGIVDSIWRPLIAFAGGQLLDPQFIWVIGIGVLLLLCLGTVGLWRQDPPVALLTILYLAVPLIGVYVASRFRPIFNERYLILASPGFFLLIGSSLARSFDFRRAWLTATTWVLVTALLTSGGLALSNHYYNPQFSKSPPWRDVLGYIAGKARPGDALIYTAPLSPIVYYNADRLPAYLIPYEPDTSLPKAIGQLEQVLEDYQRVWLVPAAPGDWWVSHQMEPWMDRHSMRLDQTFFRIVHIGLYESPATFFDTMTPQSVTFGDGIQLDGFRLADGESPLVVEPGEAVPLTLVWHAEQAPTMGYTVFTHLVGPDGMLWGQWDNPPVWGTYPTTEWGAGETVFDQYLIPVKEDAPHGEYHLLVGLYDPGSGARLPVVNDKEQVIGDSIQIDAAVIVSEQGD